MTLFSSLSNWTASKFRTAEWHHLAMLNFDVDPKVLRPIIRPEWSWMTGGPGR